MRMLFVLPVYEPAYSLGGGVVSLVSTLCRALVKQGVSVTLYTTNATGKDRPLDVPLSQPAIFLEFQNKILGV